MASTTSRSPSLNAEKAQSTPAASTGAPSRFSSPTTPGHDAQDGASRNTIEPGSSDYMKEEENGLSQAPTPKDSTLSIDEQKVKIELDVVESIEQEPQHLGPLKCATKKGRRVPPGKGPQGITEAEARADFMKMRIPWIETSRAARIARPRGRADNALAQEVISARSLRDRATLQSTAKAKSLSITPEKISLADSAKDTKSGMPKAIDQASVEVEDFLGDKISNASPRATEKKPSIVGTKSRATKYSGLVSPAGLAPTVRFPNLRKRILEERRRERIHRALSVDDHASDSSGF